MPNKLGILRAWLNSTDPTLAGGATKVPTDEMVKEYVAGHGSVYQFGSQGVISWTANNIYYFGNLSISAGTSPGNRRVYIHKAGTINVCRVNFYNSGTLASNETSSVYIRINNSTDYLISGSVLHNAVYTTYPAAALGIIVNPDDYFEIHENTGNFGTAPTYVYASGSLMVE